MSKLPRDWDEFDILTMIDLQIRESITLDFKTRGSIAKSNTRRNDDVNKDAS